MACYFLSQNVDAIFGASLSEPPQLLVSIAPACVCTYVAASDVWERVRRQMSENEYSIV